MSEQQQQPDIEVIGAATPPQLSEAALADYNRFLNDPAFARDFPQQHAALRASVDNALAATGQDHEPAPDNRSPARALHDARVSFADDGKIILPAALATIIEREAADEPADRETVTAELKAAGVDPKKALANAQALLDRAGSSTKANRLSAHAIAQLIVYAGHLQKHAANRPQ